MTDNVSLTFDPTSFTKGLEAIVGKLDTLNTSMNKSSASMTEGLKRTGLSAMNLVKSLLPIGLAFGAMRSAMRNIPEIGRTFSMAGEIMSRNFLWPLRKELVPMLQKLLDWVRDNRAMFVKWGTVLVSYFRMVSGIISGFVKLLKGMWDRLFAGLERIFGKTTQTVTDVVNLILVKIAFVAEFIMAILEPVFAFLVDSFLTAIEYVKAFAEGFMEAFGSLSEPFEDMFSSMGRLLGLFDGLNEKSSTLVSIFKVLGAVIGTLVRGALAAIAQSIDSMVSTIEDLVYGVRYAKALISGDTEAKKQLKAEREQQTADRDKRLKDRWGAVGESGKRAYGVVKGEFSGEPAGQVNNTSNSKSSVQNNEIKINVVGASDPQRTADRTAAGVTKALNDERVKRGHR